MIKGRVGVLGLYAIGFGLCVFLAHFPIKTFGMESNMVRDDADKIYEQLIEIMDENKYIKNVTDVVCPLFNSISMEKTEHLMKKMAERYEDVFIYEPARRNHSAAPPGGEVGLNVRRTVWFFRTQSLNIGFIRETKECSAGVVVRH